MNEQEFAELAAGDALDALSPDDQRAYEAALTAHPEWAHIAEEDEATVVALSAGVSEIAPPAALRADLLTLIATTPQHGAAAVFSSRTGQQQGVDADAAPGPDSDSTTDADPALGFGLVEPPGDTSTMQTIARGRWTRGLLGLAASFVLLLAIGFGAAVVGQQLNRPASQIALEQIEAAPDAESASTTLEEGGEATAHWSGSLGKAVLVADDLPPLSEDEAYELWFVREGAPISAGVFTTSDGQATAILDGEMHAGDVIAVTVEQAGGSPTGQPTSDPIVTIPTA